MHSIVVTLKSNVEFDSEENILRDDDGEIVLKDDDDVGIIAATHVIPLSQLDEKGNIMAGFVTRCEIYWDVRRSPSPDMVDPADIIWLSIVGEDDDTDSDDNDDDDPTDGGEEVLEPEYEEAV